MRMLIGTSGAVPPLILSAPGSHDFNNKRVFGEVKTFRWQEKSLVSQNFALSQLYGCAGIRP